MSLTPSELYFFHLWNVGVGTDSYDPAELDIV